MTGMIVNARMYAVAPAAEAAWRALFAYVGERAGCTWSYAEHAAPAPIRDLWARPDGACVFMCGFPYATSFGDHQLLAAPVPDLPRYGDRPVYFTEFLVRDEAPFTRLGKAFGSRLACMLPESNSGNNAPRRYLLGQTLTGIRALFQPTREPTPTPRQVIDAVRNGAAEVGVVDSYVLDLLRQHAPERLAGLRTIAVTPASPMPPLVAAPGIEAELVERVRAILLGSDRDDACRQWLATLRLSRFAPVAAQDYAVLARYAREADAAGFALTGELF